MTLDGIRFVRKQTGDKKALETPRSVESKSSPTTTLLGQGRAANHSFMAFEEGQIAGQIFYVI